MDGYNGLLLSPEADHSIEQGLFLFENDGHLVHSSKSNLGVLQFWKIEPNQNGEHFVPHQIEFLENC